VKPPGAPIRFLLLVVGGWVSFRVIALVPLSGSDEADTAGREPRLLAEAAQAPPAPATSPAAVPFPDSLPREGANGVVETAMFRGPVGVPDPNFKVRAALIAPSSPWAASGSAPLSSPRSTESLPSASSPSAVASVAPETSLAGPVPPGLVPAPPAVAHARRWSASAWLFLRDEGGGGLAPGGTLGGSQAGVRALFRVNDDERRPISLSGRVYVPIDRPRGAEAAMGLDWQPLASLPIHILAERRQRLGRDGRSDFSLTVYGGGERRVLRGRVRLEAYGQAGIVGVEERDLFADGAIRASVAAGPIELGAGAWGGAQPGASRIDIGPQASVRLPVGRAAIRVSAEYRFRIAGDAAPSSGPALTLATGF